MVICTDNVTLRKFDVNPSEFDKMYTSKDLIVDMLY